MQMPNYDAFANHYRSSPHYSNSTGQYLVTSNNRAGSASSVREHQQHNSNSVMMRADDAPHAPQSARSQASRPGTAQYGGSARVRPQTAPAQRGPDREDIPSWARDNIFTPTFDKTVETSRSRPASAKVRPQSGLPLSFVPKWISQDKKVLSFEAYFKESVQESRLEHYRIRRCVVQYFLEDDTIKISEPREENSGIPQGSFLKRHKVCVFCIFCFVWVRFHARCFCFCFLAFLCAQSNQLCIARAQDLGCCVFGHGLHALELRGPRIRGTA